MRIIKTGGALIGIVLLTAMLYAGLARSAATGSHIAAFVMDLKGTTEPPLAIHREIAAGTQIAILSDARLSLLHYTTCSIVDFSGGTVKVTEQGLEAVEANIKSRKRGPCARVHTITRRGVVGAGVPIISSVIKPSPKVEQSSEVSVVAPNGLIVVTGVDATDAETAAVLDNDRKVVGSEVPIRLESFRLSGDLKPGRTYLISIHFHSSLEPVEVPISISATDVKSLLILRLE